MRATNLAVEFDWLVVVYLTEDELVDEKRVVVDVSVGHQPVSAQQRHARVALLARGAEVDLTVETAPVGLRGLALGAGAHGATVQRQAVQLNQLIHQEVAFDVRFGAKSVNEICQKSA